MNLGFYLELLYHIADTAIEVIMDVPLHRKHTGMENMLPPPVIAPPPPAPTPSANRIEKKITKNMYQQYFAH